ncbi:RNA-binding protein 48-like [Biomphalaria glabrata]|uniref:RNA-binding protein 48 n=1 Tax=Biomphalaria glabrata TaxID=6526 RepID=A0A9W2ZPD1_BIOGL|nr:RNA-binding protein 48-like [Biomphalaria glabrata]
MDLEIPAHHIKQEVCATRSPYREGRHAKAVKVYTVNNESSYLLIQGVPSVGATEELQKLCESFGEIVQFNPLDDYPCSDKYTEVHLVKYKKIMSARFAKRKLDDYSFFGGVLHVCYVPEYETVNETREKLQDRRRVVASKLKQYEATDQVHVRTSRVSNERGRTFTSGNNSNETPIYHCSALPEEKTNPHIHNRAYQPVSMESAATKDQTYIITEASNQPDMTLETFQLPPPPKEYTKHYHKPVAKIPRLHRNANITPTIHKPVTSTVGSDSIASETNPLQKRLQIEGIDNSSMKTLPDGSQVIVRNVPNTKPAPKFIPRQTIKFTPKKSEQTKMPDSLDLEIKKNAFKLGEVQGPSGEINRKRALSPTQKSVNETILAIRSKITKVIAQETKKTS